jgi:Na+/melibiose symporter-like transporter
MTKTCNNNNSNTSLSSLQLVFVGAGIWLSGPTLQQFAQIIVPNSAQFIYYTLTVWMFLGSKVRRVRSADNLTAICEPIV